MHTLPETLIESNPLFGALVNQLAALVRSSGAPDEFAAYESVALTVANAATREVLRRRL